MFFVHQVHAVPKTVKLHRNMPEHYPERDRTRMVIVQRSRYAMGFTEVQGRVALAETASARIGHSSSGHGLIEAALAPGSRQRKHAKLTHKGMRVFGEPMRQFANSTTEMREHVDPQTS